MERWYALQTKPRKERVVYELLLKRDIEAYLPLLMPSKPSARQPDGQPFFARYLFARLDLDTVPLSSVNWMQGMSGVVSFGGQPAVVDDEVIRWLKARLAQLGTRDYHRGLPLTPSSRMRIVEGPLKGMQAIFDRRVGADARARVLIQLLGRLTAAEVPLAWLDYL